MKTKNTLLTLWLILLSSNTSLLKNAAAANIHFDETATQAETERQVKSELIETTERALKMHGIIITRRQIEEYFHQTSDQEQLDFLTKKVFNEPMDTVLINMLIASDIGSNFLQDYPTLQSVSGAEFEALKLNLAIHLQEARIKKTMLILNQGFKIYENRLREKIQTIEMTRQAEEMNRLFTKNKALQERVILLEFILFLQKTLSLDDGAFLDGVRHNLAGLRSYPSHDPHMQRFLARAKQIEESPYGEDLDHGIACYPFDETQADVQAALHTNTTTPPHSASVVSESASATAASASTGKPRPPAVAPKPVRTAQAATAAATTKQRPTVPPKPLRTAQGASAPAIARPMTKEEEEQDRDAFIERLAQELFEKHKSDGTPKTEWEKALLAHYNSFSIAYSHKEKIENVENFFK